jgi:ATP-dependent Clp protease ATP-binding subunit ClpB
MNEPSSRSLGQTGNECVHKALDIKTELSDHYVSVEHLLLAAASTNGFSKQLFAKMNTDQNKLKDAVIAVRGGHHATSRNPENVYEALDKYSVDLTEAARQGKLDPVIGRDQEIRRTIQILSRRTKNNPILLGEPGVVSRACRAIRYNHVTDSMTFMCLLCDHAGCATG